MSVDIFVEIFTSIVLAYCLLGAAYTLRLTWDSITARCSGLIALACVWAFWPVILWAEVGHSIKERARQRAHRIPSEEYLQAVRRLSAERRARCRGESGVN